MQFVQFEEHTRCIGHRESNINIIIQPTPLRRVTVVFPVSLLLYHRTPVTVLLLK